MGVGRVRVVIVTHQAAAFIGRCLDAVLASEWPAAGLEVVVVDNASTDGTPELVAADFPQVDLRRSPTNLGFGGANNLGLRDLAGVHHVALVNPDLFVEPGWLAPLVATLEADPGVGAACPKVVLAPRFAEVVLTSPTATPGGGDHRTLGLRLEGVEVDGRDVWDDCAFPDGFSWDEGHARWTTGRGVLWVAAGDATEAVLRIGGEPEPRVVLLPDERFDVLNSVGSMLTPEGYGADRGWLEHDRGQHDAPADVEAWHGGCVLLSTAYLHDVGLFDEPLFLYYDDLDLSLRGRRRRWRYRTAPTSTARHLHRASTRHDEGRFVHLNHRNRLVVVARHRGWRGGAALWAGYLRHEVGGNARGEVFEPLRHGRRPHPRHTVARLRSAAAAARMLLAGRRGPVGGPPG